jgi:hypothetical protein
MVGSAVTMNLPLRPGDDVTSTWPTLMPMSTPHDANCFQVSWRPLQAGHHGA